MPNIELLNVRRINEAAHSDNLALDEVQVLENLVLDRPAWEKKPYVRGGFSLDTGWDYNSPIKRMQDLVDSSGNAVLVVSSGTTLKGITDSGVNSLITGANSQGTFHVAPLGQGKYAASNGYDRPSILSGSNLATVRPLVLSPMATPDTMTLQEGGNLTANSYYRWVLVNVTDQGEISEISYILTCNVVGDWTIDGATTTATARKMFFNGIPNPTDSRVTGKRLYRTKGGGRVFYLAATLDLNAYSFTDSMADDQLDTGEMLTFLGTPRSMKAMTFHKGRLFAGNFTKDYTNALMPPAMSNVSFKYDTAPTLGLAVGLYRVAISYVDQDGRESALSPAAMLSVTYTGDQAGIAEPLLRAWPTGFPFPRNGAGEIDKSIATINLYRTKANQEGPYYFLDSCSVQTLVDNHNYFKFYEPDSSLQYTYPRRQKLSTETVRFENGVAFSDINRPSMFPQENVLLVNPEEDDSITGLLDDGDGILVFKNNSISKVYTSGSPISWRTVRISSVIGCTNPETLVQTGSRYFFVHNKEVWVYSSGELKLISEAKKVTLLNMTEIRSASYWTDRKWYVLVGQNSLGSVILAYDEKLDSWYHFTSKLTVSSGANEDTLQSVSEKRYGSKKGRLMIGSWNSVLYYNEGINQDFSWNKNRDIEVHLTSRTFIFDNAVGKVRLRKIWLRYRTYNAISPIIQHFVKDVRTQRYRGLNGVQSQDGEPLRSSVDSWSPVVDPNDCLMPERMVYMIQGTIMVFMGMELSYNVINRGSRA